MTSNNHPLQSKNDTAPSILHLSALGEEDYPTLYQWFSDVTELHLWSGSRQPVPYEDFVADIKERTGHTVLMLIRETSSGKPMGVFQLYDMDLSNGTAAYVVYVAKEWRRGGYFHLATHEATLFALKSFPLRKIYLDVYEFNPISESLIRASGYTEQGRLRQQIWWGNRFWDIGKYACSRQDLQSLLVRVLGPWADGLGQDAPEGFTKAEAQRLDMAIVTATARSGRARPDRDYSPSKEAGTEGHEEDWPQDIADYVRMVHSSKEGYSVEEGFPGFADWTRDQWRAFLVPSGHILHVGRGDDGTLMAALACRDEVYRGEPATRIWSLASNPNLPSEERERAEMRVCLECAEQALQRGRTKLFIYVHKGTERASRVTRLLGENPEMLPFGGTMIIVSDLNGIVGRGRRLAGAACLESQGDASTAGGDT